MTSKRDIYDITADIFELGDTLMMDFNKAGNREDVLELHELLRQVNTSTYRKMPHKLWALSGFVSIKLTNRHKLKQHYLNRLNSLITEINTKVREEYI